MTLISPSNVQFFKELHACIVGNCGIYWTVDSRSWVNPGIRVCVAGVYCSSTGIINNDIQGNACCVAIASGQFLAECDVNHYLRVANDSRIIRPRTPKLRALASISVEPWGSRCERSIGTTDWVRLPGKGMEEDYRKVFITSSGDTVGGGHNIRT